METSAVSQSIDSVQVQAKRLAFLESRAKEMEDSIRYAKRLQLSILPNDQIFSETFEDAFVMFNPKDLVSGDFYWISVYGRDVYFAVGDCTGHGVPGAMVNIAGNTMLKQIIRRKGLSDPALIMKALDKELIGLFNDNQTEGQTYDGMDIVFCKFNLDTLEGSFCGAGRPLLLIRDGELIEFKKGLASIGYSGFGNNQFERVDIKLQKGDQFYLFSDGYTDQFGGENIKKFNRKRFRNLLLSIADKKMADQKKELEFSFKNWMGKQEQIDDVCVLGVRI